MVERLLPRLFDKIEITNGFIGCWLWRGSLSTHGKHGRIRVKDKIKKVHRVMYSLVKGQIDETQVVRHICNESKCCNPFHLCLGSQLDNVADKVEARRQFRQFTDAEVEEIRNRSWSGVSRARLAWDYSVGLTTIGDIITRRTYKYVR